MGQKQGMKLFFETSAQAQLFLLMLPVGMTIALLADIAGKAGRLCPVWDVLTMLLCFGAVGAGVVLFRDESLRVYHFLAVTMGALLYLTGVRKVFTKSKTKILRKRWKPRQEIIQGESNNTKDTNRKG